MVFGQVKAIAVLDRTKEDLAPSLPLHADVLTAMSEAGVYKKVVGGNYGLGSKEFAPRALVYKAFQSFRIT